MAIRFSNWDELASDSLHEKIVACSNRQQYKYQYGCWDMTDWSCVMYPELLSEGQLRSLVLRSLTYETLNVPIRDILANFRFETTLVILPECSFRVPSGPISGELQGMFMWIDEEGSINT